MREVRVRHASWSYEVLGPIAVTDDRSIPAPAEARPPSEIPWGARSLRTILGSIPPVRAGDRLHSLCYDARLSPHASTA